MSHVREHDSGGHRDGAANDPLPGSAGVPLKVVNNILTGILLGGVRAAA
jgi:hypothetical protein